MKSKSSIEPRNSSTDNNNAWPLPGHKRCRSAEYNSCGHSAGDLEEITPAGSSVPPIVLNGTNGFSESLCFFEIPVQLLEGSQETGPCHGSSFESKCQFSA